MVIFITVVLIRWHTRLPVKVENSLCALVQGKRHIVLVPVLASLVFCATTALNQVVAVALWTVVYRIDGVALSNSLSEQSLDLYLLLLLLKCWPPESQLSHFCINQLFQNFLVASPVHFFWCLKDQIKKHRIREFRCGFYSRCGCGLFTSSDSNLSSCCC